MIWPRQSDKKMLCNTILDPFRSVGHLKNKEIKVLKFVVQEFYIKKNEDKIEPSGTRLEGVE